MSLVADTLARAALGTPRQVKNLTLIPLLGGGATAAPYLSLREAIAAGAIEVTEVSESGSVPTLIARNRGDRPVLILDGEELVGARQNRVLNLSVLIPAATTVNLPVSCVEQGRWAWRSRAFHDSKQAMHADGRRKNIRKVNESLRHRRSYAGDQSSVWDDIADKAERMRVESPTGALGDVYQRHDQALDEYVLGILPEPGQRGAVFAVNGKVRGLELFDDPATFAGAAGKLVRSYALDALEQGGDAAATDRAAVEAFLAEVSAAPLVRFPGVGVGETLRLESPAVVGAGLAVADRLLHLSAFPAEG